MFSSVNAGVGERAAHVLEFLRLLATGNSLESRLGLLPGSPVDVAEPGDARVRQSRVSVHVARTAATKSYDGHVDLVVGAPDARGGGGDRRCPR